MNAEFLYKSNSGMFPEKHFGNPTPNCLWVKFVDKDEQEWIGSFERGWVKDATFIINFKKTGKAFIVVGGQTYLIDLNTQEQLNKTNITDTKTAIIDEQEDYIYYSDGANLHYMDCKGDSFILLDNYHFEDIKLVELKDNKLKAIYWNYQAGSKPFHFEIDVLTKAIKDSFQDSDRTIDSNEKPKQGFFTRLMTWIKQ